MQIYMKCGDLSIYSVLANKQSLLKSLITDNAPRNRKEMVMLNCVFMVL